jgi:hypothetical protein
MKHKRALSIRQPFAELILLHKKKIEYRTIKTNIIDEEIYIYASSQLRPSDDKSWKCLRKTAEQLDRGVLVGTMIIVSCSEEKNSDGHYEWHLAKPKRLPRVKKPTNRPNPVWFHPFKTR